MFFWSWPIVIIGQTFVALNFAELASHFPVAGSIYQWSKRLSHRTLGWFTGWFYFWAGVVTVTAVAVHVAARRRGHRRRRRLPRFAGPDPGVTTMFAFIALATLVITTLINAFGVKLLSIINNIGVGDRDPGDARLRARPAVLRQQPEPVGPVRHVRRSRRRQTAISPGLPDRHVHGAVRRLRLRHGRARSARRRIDAEPPGARAASCRPSGSPGSSASSSCWRSSCRSRTSPAAIAEGLAVGFPIATTINENLTRRRRRRSRSASSTCSSSSRRSSSAPWPSRARRPG